MFQHKLYYAFIFINKKKVIMSYNKNGFLPMTNNNIDKILLGYKTRTTRSQKAAEQFGLKTGEHCFCNYNYKNASIKITCLGYLTVEEAGGKYAMLKAEGVSNINELMFKQTRDWFENNTKRLWVYEVEHLKVN